MARTPTLKERAVELGLEVSDDPIQPGDTYLAERNTGPKLLTCEKVDPRCWIQPVEMEYSYNTWDCIKVIGTVES